MHETVVIVAIMRYNRNTWRRCSMKFYKKLAELGCFSYNDLIKLTENENTAHSLASAYLKKGYIERVRRDLYVVVSIETGQPIPTRYQIASSLAEDACISHHSAFEFYGYANQVFYEVYVTTQSRFKDFEYEGVSYRRIASRSEAEKTTEGGVRATSVECTVIDSIADFEKIGGLEETLRCIQLIPALDPDKLLSALAVYNTGFLYQKTGYILETLNEGLHLPKSFFDECVQYVSRSKRYFSKERKNYVLHENWNLFAPPDLRVLINKGVSDYDAV